MPEVSVGNELKDSFAKTNSWVQNNLLFLNDIEYFYKQRAIIEKEYSTKLQNLCSEGFKRKAKVSSAVSVGTDPAVTPGSLECSTLVVWNDIMNKTELVAQQRNKFSSQIVHDVVDKITALRNIADHLQKKYGDVNNLAIKEKEQAVTKLKKAKSTYDSACEDVEHVRQKTEKSSKEKLQKKLAEKETKMNVCKNNYLVSINQANRLKDKFYYQDLPEIVDGLQDINEFKTVELNGLLTSCIAIETRCNDTINNDLNSSKEVINQNTCELDTIMFIKHNLGTWSEPKDFYFEPSPIWHDDDALITGVAELEELKKHVDAANRVYGDSDVKCETLQVEINSLAMSKVELKQGKKLEKPYSYYVDKSVDCLRTFIAENTKKIGAEVEIEYIQSNTGDADLTISTQAQTKKKGFGFFKHREKTTSDAASGAASVASGSRASRSGSVVSSRPGRGASVSAGSVMSTESHKEGIALYNYEASDADEVSMAVGERLEVLSIDESGWTQVKKANKTGLVPTSFLTIQTVGGKSRKAPPVVAPRKSGKKMQQAKVLYDYVADGEDEVSIFAGDVVVVLGKDEGGWTKGESRGKTGLFPSSYVSLV